MRTIDKRTRLTVAGLILCASFSVGLDFAQAADPFYSHLLQTGKLAFLRGDYEEATESLRIACFGLLDNPTELASGLVYLGLVNARVGYEKDNWSVQFWTRNLFDRYYAVRGFYFGNEPPDFPATLYTRAGDPRQLGVTFDLRF